MNKQRFSIISFVLGAAALVSFNAGAAGTAANSEPWPLETPAMVYFGDTDSSGTGPSRPDAVAKLAFGDPTDQNGPAALASSGIVDTQLAQLRPDVPAPQADIMLAHSGGAAAGMH